MNYGGVNILGVISTHQHVGTLNNAKINKVTEVLLLPFAVSFSLDQPFYQTSTYTTRDQMNNVLADVRSFLCDGFYFSYGYDITCSRQRRIQWMEKRSKDPLEMVAADKRYFWNFSLYRDFISQQVEVKWFTPLINGYFG